MSFKLLLVGCGKMGAAMLERMGDDALVTVIEPGFSTVKLQKQPNVTWHMALDQIDPAFIPDIVLLAVKPQHMPNVLPAYGHFKQSVFLSIAAGLTVERLANLLGHSDAAVVRVMPNLPASVGAGMSVAFANQNVTTAQHRLADYILSRVGATAWLDDEIMMDAVTALSGSGPGYFFAMCEIMAKIGEQLGLPATLAAQLARQTMIGSGALLAQAPESAESLRKAVSSPGGTTEAALQHLMGDEGLSKLMTTAMQAAVTRSKQLAQ